MLRILLAEDSPSDVYLIRAALEEHSVLCPLQLATDGRELLQILYQQEMLPEPQVGLIILDLNLPRHDGIEILQHIHDSASLASIPVVVLTSSDSPRDRTVASDLGAARYLRKPSQLDQFMGLGAVFKELLVRPRPKAAGI